MKYPPVPAFETAFRVDRGPATVTLTRLTAHTPRQNHLLAALPASDYRRILGGLELVPLPFGWAVYEAGSRQGYVYFPTDSIVTLLYVMGNGSSTEIALTGNDGVVGISLLMGGEATTSRAMVQSAGHAFRLRAAILKQEFDRGGVLQGLLLRYTQSLITQMSQTAVCNRHHTVEQRLCRWLLLSLDRLPANRMIVTRELMANMLGMQWEVIAEITRRLQVAGIMRYDRGKISILNRSKLEAAACECYAVVKQETDRLLPRAC